MIYKKVFVIMLDFAEKFKTASRAKLKWKEQKLINIRKKR